MKVERYLSKYKLLSIPCPYSLIVRQNSCDSAGNIREDNYTIWLEYVDFEYIFKNFDKNIGTIEFIIPSIVDGIMLNNMFRIYQTADLAAIHFRKKKLENDLEYVRHLKIIGTGKPIICKEYENGFQDLSYVSVFSKRQTVTQGRDIHISDARMSWLDKITFEDFDATQTTNFNFGFEGKMTRSLQNIDAKGLKLSKVNYFPRLGKFYDMSNHTLDFQKIDFSDMVDAMWLFQDSYISSEQLENSGILKTLKPIQTQFMFADCKNITKLADVDLTRADQQLQMYEDSQLSGELNIGRNLNPVDSVQYKNADQICILSYAKYRSTNIEKVNIDGYNVVYPAKYAEDAQNIRISYEQLFSDCLNLRSVQIRNIVIQLEGVSSLADNDIRYQYIDFGRVFYNDDKLEEITIENIYAPLYSIDIQYLFQGCINLKRVILRNIIVRNIDRVINIFNTCNNIQEVIIDNVYMLNPSGKSKKLKDLIEADITKHCDSGIELQRSRELLSKIKEQYSQGVSIKDVKKYSQIQLYNKCLNLE